MSPEPTAREPRVLFYGEKETGRRHNTGQSPEGLEKDLKLISSHDQQDVKKEPAVRGDHTSAHREAAEPGSASLSGLGPSAQWLPLCSLSTGQCSPSSRQIFINEKAWHAPIETPPSLSGSIQDKIRKS